MEPNPLVIDFEIEKAEYINNDLKPFIEGSPEIERIQKVARFIPILGDGFVMQLRDGGPDKGKLEFPGGKIEKTDINSAYAAERELNEEIGLGFSAVEYLDYLETTYRIVDGVLYISDFFMADDIASELLYEKSPEKYEEICSWDFIVLYNPKDFAFDHYAVAKRFALNIGN
jgi:8-oxo-dGTP pyrophosphatase MutT (NUDIX family)